MTRLIKVMIDIRIILRPKTRVDDNYVRQHGYRLTPISTNPQFLSGVGWSTGFRKYTYFLENVVSELGSRVVVLKGHRLRWPFNIRLFYRVRQPPSQNASLFSKNINGCLVIPHRSYRSFPINQATGRHLFEQWTYCLHGCGCLKVPDNEAWPQSLLLWNSIEQ